MSPTDRLKLRQAAAAGKKASDSMSLFLEVNDLEAEEELSSTWPHSLWQKARGWAD